MTLFTSTYTNKIDKKGRVSVPAPFRQVLAQQTFQGVYVFPSIKHTALEACGADEIEMLSRELDNPDMSAEERELLEETIFGGSTLLPFDGEGRIVLPQALLSFAGITEDAAFFGRRKTFEIWNPQALEARVGRAREVARNRDISISSLLANARRPQMPRIQ